MNHSPENILRYMLVDEMLGTMPSEGDAWPIGLVEPDKPDNAITIFGTVGVIQHREILGGFVAERYGAQIRVRASSYSEGVTKAQAIVTAIDSVRRSSIDIEESEYLIHSVSRTTQMVPLGNEQGTSRHLFTINVLINVTQES